MKVFIKDDYEQVSQWAANHVRNRILHFQPTESRIFNLGKEI